eukprot:Hpha_TRINITY_DN16594_c3_g2::TRINITY_DN16594_c3_g2_i3::g.136657::m.136657
MPKSRSPCEMFENLARLIDDVAEGNRENSHVHESKNPLAFFDCVTEPGVTAGNFLRLVEPLVAPEEWVVTAVLAHKLLDRSDSCLGVFNAHRLMLTAVMVSIKLRRDVSCVPRAFFEKTGVPIKDLVKMEKIFLSLMDWEVNVIGQEYQRVAAALAMPNAGKNSDAPSIIGRLCEDACRSPGGNMGRLKQMLDQSRTTVRPPQARSCASQERSVSASSPCRKRIVPRAPSIASQ